MVLIASFSAGMSSDNLVTTDIARSKFGLISFELLLR